MLPQIATAPPATTRRDEPFYSGHELKDVTPHAVASDRSIPFAMSSNDRAAPPMPQKEEPQRVAFAPIAIAIAAGAEVMEVVGPAAAAGVRAAGRFLSTPEGRREVTEWGLMGVEAIEKAMHPLELPAVDRQLERMARASIPGTRTAERERVFGESIIIPERDINILTGGLSRNPISSGPPFNREEPTRDRDHLSPSSAAAIRDIGRELEAAEARDREREQREKQDSRDSASSSRNAPEKETKSWQDEQRERSDHRN
jgi:hypothetical protein